MGQDFFINLPSELTTNILSRLPLRSIALIKCVCKPWLNLLQSDNFAKSKIKTPPALVRLVPVTNSIRCTIFEFEDEDEADAESHALHFHPLRDFEIPHGNGNSESICRAQQTNGLLLVYSSSERQCFSIFSAPAVDGLAGDGLAIDVKLNVLRDCLCLSYTLDDKVVIWLMKEYRVEESWTMEYQISIDFNFDYGFDISFDFWNLINIYPIKVFQNGDVLMFMEEKCLIYYSNKTRTIRHAGMLADGTTVDDIASAMIYTPSLFSLKNFAVERVISF
ncbi:F-box protein-like protein [Salvia divinorum]|uniref:F-box protein-like protein n=1 Tax=Salvia divinorum TaxID=28513 RepID=A0ABD1FRV3_SALDI